MKQTVRYMTFIVLLMSSMIAWADNRVIIVAPTNGTVTIDNANPVGTATVTLTITPTAGQYYIVPADILVEKTSSVAQTRTNGPAIVETIDVVEGKVEDNGAGTYTFKLPEGFGARVSATFTECATFSPVVSISGWTYGESAKAPSLGETNKSGGAVTYTYATKGSTGFSATVPSVVGDYTVKASIAAKGHYKAAEATADFTISKQTLDAATLNDKTNLSSASLGYTGSPIAPTVTIAGMTEGTDFIVKYKNGTNEATTEKPTNYGTR